MVHRLFSKLWLSKRLLAGGVTLGGAGVGFVGNQMRSRHARRHDPPYTPAEEHFYTSSLYPVPLDWKGRVWSIRNDYPEILAEGAGGQHDDGLPVSSGPIISPSGDPLSDAPWLKPGTDFRMFPAAYCALIKEYCLEGNVENDFVVHNNEVCFPPLYSDPSDPCDRFGNGIMRLGCIGQPVEESP